MRFSSWVAAVVFTATAWAQQVPFYAYEPLGQVKEFLQLSDSQLQAILANNNEYNNWSAEEQTRIAQLQKEIAAETAKQVLDPAALGARYADIETVCREVKAQAVEYRTRNVALLTDPQKAKLTVLEEAMKLLPLASEAQSGNLTGTITVAPYGFIATNLSTSTSSNTISGIYGCTAPAPFGLIRGGNFATGTTRIPKAMAVAASGGSRDR